MEFKFIIQVVLKQPPWVANPRDDFQREIADLGAYIRRNYLHGSGRVSESNYSLTKSEQEVCKDFLDHYEIRAFTI